VRQPPGADLPARIRTPPDRGEPREHQGGAMNTTSALPDGRNVEIPDVDLATFTLGAAMRLGDKPALIDGSSGRALSYAELERSVRSFASGLAARGFARGDTFCISTPNVPEYP